MNIHKNLLVFAFSILLLSCSTNKKPATQQQGSSKDTATTAEKVALKDPQGPTTQQAITGKYSRTNEDGDYWYFYLTGPGGNEIRFIYTSENILKNKATYEGKMLKVKYSEKEIEEAGSGKKTTEKYLEGVEIQQ